MSCCRAHHQPIPGRCIASQIAAAAVSLTSHKPASPLLSPCSACLSGQRYLTSALPVPSCPNCLTCFCSRASVALTACSSACASDLAATASSSCLLATSSCCRVATSARNLLPLLLPLPLTDAWTLCSTSSRRPAASEVVVGITGIQLDGCTCSRAKRLSRAKQC